ncbi:MAG: 30S ribosomal protein S17 [Candidatus Omnitrophota bacterium]|jgi:small subunit ribosomal protein S17|nr:MAG: 30S ribosomal protein S17 [Candidatus Omnitrophota bacterium]
MGKTKELLGTVIRDKMNKTIVVSTVLVAKHPKYKKTIKRFSRYKVHDEKNAAKIGDIVKIQETRPLSKDKRFKLVSVVKASARLHAQEKAE